MTISDGVHDATSVGSATLVDALRTTATHHGARPAICSAGGEVILTWREYEASARHVAVGLARLGVAAGDTVAMLLTNRPEFHITDAAALMLGATPFSMYNTYPPEQLLHLLGDTGCRIVVTERGLLDGVLAARELGAIVDQIIVVDDAPEGTTPWETLRDVANPYEPSEISPDSIATIIYTSGTTGPPKGVQLTHRNLLAMAESISEVMPIDPAHRNISYLPMAHVAERVCSHYMPMIVGFSIVCCPVPSDVARLLPEVRPNVFFSPPRLWEKLRSAVMSGIEASADELRSAATAAIDAGLQMTREREAGREPTGALVQQHEATEAVRAAIRRQIGLDNVAAGITGAAPCPPQVIEFFHALGVPLQEIYGLSESAGLITSTRSGEWKLGTVGRVLPGMELRLATDGEILARGPLVMAGYRNRPEATAEMIDGEGWLHTGDVGTLDAEGYLRIIDRKKELIISAAGKNMSPSNIEAKLKEGSPLIGQVCCIGDARPYNVALIVLEIDALAAFAKQHDIGDTSLADLAVHPSIVAEIGRGVERANAALARVEQIKRFTILPVDWQPDSDELTPTMKLKRRPIATKYAAQVEALYAAPRD